MCTALRARSFECTGYGPSERWAGGAGGAEAGLTFRPYRAADTSKQSPSAHGSPNEGFLYGFKPLLYPWPPGLALFGAFAGACLSSLAEQGASV